MLKIKQFPVNPIEENCYVIYDETSEACIIDCGCFTQKDWNNIYDYITSNNLKVVHLLNTHAHFDHILGEGYVYRDLQLRPKGSEADSNLYIELDKQLAMFMLPTNLGVPPLPPMEGYLKEGDTISFGTHSLTVYETPGHTPGGLCFYCEEEKVVFVGDTLFQMSVGRTDLPGGNHEQLLESISGKILTLPSETKIYTGHGPSTTVDFETKHNPFLGI